VNDDADAARAETRAVERAKIIGANRRANAARSRSII
jgi:hypothetical protein